MDCIYYLYFRKTAIAKYVINSWDSFNNITINDMLKWKCYAYTFGVLRVMHISTATAQAIVMYIFSSVDHNECHQILG